MTDQNMPQVLSPTLTIHSPMVAAHESWFVDKKVAVLGASGFIGSQLVRRLLPIAKEIVSFARGSASGQLEVLAGTRLILGDVRNIDDVRRALVGADVVFHFAGPSGSVESTAHAQADLQTNVLGLLNTLEAARGMSTPPRIVFPGSRLQYGRRPPGATAEDAPLCPTSPYGVHKNFCEAYLDYYARVHGVPYAVARLTNPYGPYTQFYAFGYNVLSQMIANALRGETLTLYGEGLQLRDYIFIDDAIEALLFLAVQPADLVCNVGTGVGTPFHEVLRMIVNAAGTGAIRSVPWPDTAAKVETGDFVADIGAMKRLGWIPKYDLKRGIATAIERLRQHGTRARA